MTCIIMGVGIVAHNYLNLRIILDAKGKLHIEPVLYSSIPSEEIIHTSSIL